MARAASRYIQDEDFIALDAGTTSLELARLLPSLPLTRLGVVTPDLEVALLLSGCEHISVFLSGGRIDPVSRACNDSDAVAYLRGLRLTMILFGFLLAIPVTIAAIIYAKYVGKKIFRLPAGDNDEDFVDKPYALGVGGQWMDEDDSRLPSAWRSFAPILIPVVLILLGTFTNAMCKTALAAVRTFVSLR